ncbi:MAG: tetratricopeptide repeat protein [Bacteroidales bacterium]|nr:tetratricopeptide repeat protein [Bacteroidales bacterium]
MPNFISKLHYLSGNRIAFIVLLLLSFILYGNTIGHYYNLDDVFVIYKNETVQKGIKAIPEIFASRYFENKQAKFGYRPVTKAVYAIEVSLFGVNPHVSHFINIVLYALMCFVVFIFLKRIFTENHLLILIWLSLLLWMFHPIHTEVVASLKNREEILYFLFGILSGICFIDFITHNNYWKFFLAILLFCISFLAKQSAFSFLLVFPFIFYYKFLKKEPIISLIQPKNWFLIPERRNILFASIVLIAAGYVMYKLPTWLFPPDELELLSFENPLRYTDVEFANFSYAAYSLLFYLKMLIFPHPLLFYYGLYKVPLIHVSDFLVWLSVIIHIIIFYVVIKYRHKNSYLLFGWLFYFLAILPFSNYFIEINGIVADRFLHGPSLGFAISLASLFYVVWTNPSKKLKKLQNRLQWIFIFILIFYAVKTIDRNNDWRSEMTLFTRDIKYLENSVKANDILAQTIMDRIMQNNPLQKPFSQLKPSLDSVIYYYEQSLKLFPENPKALNNIANIYINFYNQPQKALEYLKKAYTYKPENFELNFNLAQCYEMLKQDSLAIPYYLKALKLEKKYPRLWQNLINLWFKLNYTDSAKHYAELMINYDTITDIPYTSIGYYYFTKKDTATAIKYWEEAFRRNPTNYQRALSLAKYFSYKNDTVKAQYYLNRAKMLMPMQQN